MTILAYIFGIAGIVANFAIYQQKDRKHLLMVKLLSDTLWTAHYCSLFAWSGAAVCAIGMLRETVFINQNKKWASSKIWLLIFLVLAIISAVLTWQSPLSILPAFASILAVFSYWRGEPKLTRILGLFISAAFLTYDVYCGSYMGIVNEIFTLTSVTIGFVRDIRTKNAHKSNNDPPA